MSVLKRNYPTLQARAAAAASGDADRIAAAAALRPYRKDSTMSSRTLALFDFGNPYSLNGGGALSVGKTFRNMVAGGGVATVTNSSGLSYHTKVDGTKDGVRFTGGAGQIQLPDVFKLPSTTKRFQVRMAMRLHAALTGTAYRSFAGWSQNSGVNAWLFGARATSLQGLFDGSAVRDIVAAPELDKVYWLTVDYDRNAGTGGLVERMFSEGVQVVNGTGYTDGNGLNQPAIAAFIGQCPSYVNGTLDWTCHRIVLEELSEVSDRPNPDGLDAGLLAVTEEYNKYSTRF